MDDWLAILSGLFMWVAGFMFGGICYGTTPFWDGVRSVFWLRS